METGSEFPVQTRCAPQVEEDLQHAFIPALELGFEGQHPAGDPPEPTG